MKKILLSIVTATAVTFALNVGEIPKNVVLSAENGGLVDGGEWHSSMIKDKLYVLFYVDPDKKDDSEAFINALHEKSYDSSKYGSIAIINLKATWLPNFAIESKLAKKQETFPQTIYVKDKTKYLVDKWELVDDSSNVIVFDKEGKVLYVHSGLINESQMQTIFKLIEEEIKSY